MKKLTVTHRCIEELVIFCKQHVQFKPEVLLIISYGNHVSILLMCYLYFEVHIFYLLLQNTGNVYISFVLMIAT
jgi:hypothetical protein